MARERTRAFLDEAKHPSRGDPAALGDGVAVLIPALAAAAEQAIADESNLQLAEMADGDEPAVRELLARCAQKLGAIRRESAEIGKRLRRVLQARREYDGLLAEIENLT